MRTAYRIVLTLETDGSYTVFVPDFDSMTQGESLADAMYMARDMIGITGITLQDIGQPIPEPGSAECVADPHDTVTYVDVDFDEYRRKEEKST